MQDVTVIQFDVLLHCGNRVGVYTIIEVTLRVVGNDIRALYWLLECLSDIVGTALAHQTGNQAGPESGFEIVRVLQLAHGVSGYKIELGERDIVVCKYGVVFPGG